jgi:hypothetical protein
MIHRRQAVAAFVQLQPCQASMVIESGPAALAGTPDHWQACSPAIHPSLRSYEALAKYAECEENMQSVKNMLNMLKIAIYAEYAEYDWKRPFQCTKSGTWVCVLTSWKERTTQLHPPNPPFQHCPLPLASICCGAALLKMVLHQQLTHRHN